MHSFVRTIRQMGDAMRYISIPEELKNIYEDGCKVQVSIEKLENPPEEKKEEE